MSEVSEERSVSTRQVVRFVLWAAVIVMIVALAVANTDDVTVDWLFGEVEVALWMVIVVSATAGAAIGYLTRWRRD